MISIIYYSVFELTYQLFSQLISFLFNYLRSFPSIALHIPTAHNFMRD